MIDFTDIQDFLDGIEAINTLQELQNNFNEEIKPLGFDKHTCLSFVDMNNPPPNAIQLFSFPEEWVSHYKKEKYFEDDIVLQTIYREATPCIWKDIKQPNRRNQKIFSEAKEFGICNGITIPIVIPRLYPCTVNIAGDNSDVDPEVFYALHLMAVHYHHRILEIGGDLFTPLRQNRLTTREKECLKWVARGKTSWEIAFILGISENAINFHIKNIFRKLDVSTRAMAVFQASQLGLIYI